MSSPLPSKSGKEGTRPSGQDQLDSTLCEELEKIVEEMTHSGRPSLEDKSLKQLKRICRTSDAYVEHAFNLLSNQLAEEHAEIRLSSFQIMNELFNRSHRFRELLVADMQEFLELTVGTNSDTPLPPPRAAANLLKEQTLKAIQEWNAKYGKAYKKLALGYGFLKYNKMVDFANLEARTAVEQRAQAARQAKVELALAQQVSKILNDMDETIPEINECLTQIDNCFELLLPHPTRYSEIVTPSEQIGSTSTGTLASTQKDQPIHTEGVSDKTRTTEVRPMDAKQVDSLKTPKQGDRSEGDTKKDSRDIDSSNSHLVEKKDGHTSPLHDGKDDDLLQQHGLPSWNFNIAINVNTDGVMLEEDEDNQAILVTLEDMNRLIKSSYLPHLAAWMEVFIKTGKHEDKLKRCMDLKEALKNAAAKYAELDIHSKVTSKQQRQSAVAANGGGDSDSEGEGFEDVPEKEGFEPVIPDHLRKEYGLDPLPTDDQDSSKTSSTQDNLNSRPSTSKSSKDDMSDSPSTTASSSSLAKSKDLESWHPLREAQHTIDDPASQAGTLQAMKERLRAIRDQHIDLKTLISSDRKRKSDDKEVTAEKRQRQELLAKAPYVPFGVDLEHWTNPDKIEAPTVVLADTAEVVWSSSAPDEVKVMEAVKDSLTTRVFNYTGKFEPVKWTCRAPLPSGKLCQRMDRFKCPFHGKIIPRDEQGKPQNPEDKAKFQLTEEQEKQAKSLLADAELQKDIEGGLGIDLGSTSSGKGKGDKKGKGKAKKYPNLTDLSKTSNTAMNRLEKKVLNKSALRRVANAMNKLEQRRYHDKYANNFNYR
ncbi:UV-stimulated scaffold protein A-like [Acanthaster planci]|uniref:UV-stimulated scaffold protein A-like n=1 Tax=Acanthaster planci TaxID=133434 RepID=A0A8B7YGZ0_ACAPL|nr:UV-stimulated scaffold protein A-like [Acanthaster planci]XP_022091852.1 UV-stimulated scaffold protein A-like [Acanthaster planci]